MQRLSPHKTYKLQRANAILADFRALRGQFDSVGMLYAEIARRNHCSDMTVRRVLAAKGLDGVQGMYKRI